MKLSKTSRKGKLSGQASIFLPVFIAVFVLVLAAAALVTFMLPETFAAKARVLVDQPPVAGQTNASYAENSTATEAEVIQSEFVLQPVVEQLDLNNKWGKKFAGGTPLRTVESLEILRKSIQVKPIRNTRLIEIQAFNENPDEAAALANAIAGSYRDRRQPDVKASTPKSEIPGHTAVRITDAATPEREPVRPNKPLNLALGVLAGILLGGCAGGAATLLKRTGTNQ